MTSQELRAALQAMPFRPFTVRGADGRSFEVRHPDFLLVSPNGRTTFVFGPSGVEFSILDVMLMTEIEFGQQGAQPATFSNRGRARPHGHDTAAHDPMSPIR